MSVVKLLVVGSPGGEQASFVGAISEVKIRSSAKTPTGGEFVPLDFGRVTIGEDLDLQMFGVERDRVGLIADAISPGIVGAILLVDNEVTSDPHFSSQALDELTNRGIALVIARTENANQNSIEVTLNLPPNTEVVDCSPADRESVKTAIIKVLEAALAAADSHAA